jgi:hypothetical protein
MPNTQIRERSIAERHRGRRELILLKPRNWRKITELGQRVGQPRHRWLRQIRSSRDLLIAEQSVIGLERAQDVETAGKRDDETPIGRTFLSRTFHALVTPFGSRTR